MWDVPPMLAVRSCSGHGIWTPAFEDLCITCHSGESRKRGTLRNRAFHPHPNPLPSKGEGVMQRSPPYRGTRQAFCGRDRGIVGKLLGSCYLCFRYCLSCQGFDTLVFRKFVDSPSDVVYNSS